MLAVAIVALVLAAIPAVAFVVNSICYRRPPVAGGQSKPPKVSVLIPARNEETCIAAAVRSALGSESVEVEVLVLDDHSEDKTTEIVGEISRNDDRVRLLNGAKLPAGWCGKQFACHQLGNAARHELLLFIDADVRLEADAIARSTAFLHAANADLVSGIPWQQADSIGEKMLIPLLHYIVLIFLPIPFMRLSRRPSLGAGCGQFFLARRTAWRKSGGHAAIRESLHDGVRLPQEFRKHGFVTDLFDAASISSCRMYSGLGDTISGLSKNAVEGMAAPSRIIPFSVLMLGGQVLPILCVVGLLLSQTPLLDPSFLISLCAVGLSYLPRVINAIRFRQSWLGAALHPLGISLFVAIQWSAFLQWLFGISPRWKGRKVSCS